VEQLYQLVIFINLKKGMINVPNSGLFILFTVLVIVLGYLWNHRQRLIYICYKLRHEISSADISKKILLYWE
jgi:hypothetical protein